MSDPFKKLPRAQGIDPGSVSPDAWNEMSEMVEENRHEQNRFKPRSSPDIKFRSRPDGFTAWLARKPAIPKTLCPLDPILKRVSTNWYLWIRSGLSQDVIPSFVGSPVGKSNLQPVTATTKLFLKVTWTPAKDYDSDLETYWIIGGGTHVSSEFIFAASAPADTQAEIDESTGVETNGVYHFLWADISVDGNGKPSIIAKRCGNHRFSFCPGTLSLDFDVIVDSMEGGFF